MSDDEAPLSIASRADQFTKGANIGVDVTGIERELASLWRQASSNRERAVTRACSWNLIVHVADDAELEGARALVDKVVFAVPSRSIVLVPRPNDPGKPIEAFVSANCQVAPGGGKLLCSEEITVMSRGGGDKLVPSLVRALLVPDVPTALLWVGAPPEPESVAFLPSIDRLIFDSARCVDADQAGGGALRSYIGLKEVALADIEWLRMGFLRSMLAAMFDPPTGTGPLDRATEIVVRGAKNGRSAARLFGSWAASRIGWTLGALDEGSAKGKGQSGAPVALTLVRDAERDTPSGLVEVVVRTTDDAGKPVEYALGDVGDGTLSVRAPGQVMRSKIAADLAMERLVIAALGARGRDPLYRAALVLAAGKAAR